MRITFGVLVFLTLTFFCACDSTSNVGVDLIDDDGVGVVFTDTVSLKARTIKGDDSLFVSNSTSYPSYLFVGGLTDPYFNQSTFDAYVVPRLNIKKPDFFDASTNQYATIDSVVMYMKYDTSRVYGETSVPHQMKVSQLQEVLDENAVLYTVDQFEADMNVATSAPFVYSSNKIVVPFESDTFTLDAAMRVHLETSFFQNLFSDTSIYLNDTIWRNTFKGLKLESDNPSQTLAFDFSSEISVNNPLNKMAVYYTLNDKRSVYLFPLSGKRHFHVERIDSGASKAGEAVDQWNTTDELLYAQGLNGYDIEVEIPHATFKNWGNVVIKKATLKCAVAPGSTAMNLSPMSRLFMDELNSAGERTLITDLKRIISAKADVNTYFGGVIVEDAVDGDVYSLYKFNITEYFDKLIRKDSEFKNRLFLRSSSPLYSIERSVLCGPEHPVYPMKLEIVYSKQK